MVLIGTALCRKCDVANLGKFSAVIERRNLHRGDAFLRRVGVLERSVLTHIGRGDAVDGKVHHGAAGTAECDIAGAVRLNIR